MQLPWPESVLSKRERVKKELMQGRELAGQLCTVFDGHESTLVSGFGGFGGGSAEGLVDKIWGSFANTLLILNGKESDEELVSGDQIQGNSTSGGSADLYSWDANHTAAIKSEHFYEESCKSTSTLKDRRGSYKRRKTTSHSWTRDTPELTEDGHAWRKYGQKPILNAKHSRNYYRCTHKIEQSCEATKHVQQIHDHPPMFRTTYYGNHTCRDHPNASELVLDCTSLRETSKLIRFGDTKQDHPFLLSFTSVKKEEMIVKEESMIIKEEIPPNDDRMMTSHDNHSWLCDYLVSPDLTTTTFESSRPPDGFESTLDQFDHEDEIFRLTIGSFDLDEFLKYI